MTHNPHIEELVKVLNEMGAKWGLVGEAMKKDIAQALDIKI